MERQEDRAPPEPSAGQAEQKKVHASVAHAEHDPMTLIRQWAARTGPARKGARLDPRLIYRPASGEAPALYDLAIGSGGAGGGVRVKVYLSLLLAVSPRDREKGTTFTPDPERWAEMMLLADPPGGGAERIRNALRWLHTQHYITRAGGSVTVNHQLSVRGEVKDYIDPYDDEKTYCNVPISLWRQGWLPLLTASELMALIVLLQLQQEQLREHGKDNLVDLYAKDRNKRFGFTDETWLKGVAGLMALGVITDRETFDKRPDEWSLAEVAWRYELDVAVFDTPPAAKLIDNVLREGHR